MISCDDSNIGSYKTIEKNGGILKDIVATSDLEKTRRYWINLNK
jgi:predicted acetyltransferase